MNLVKAIADRVLAPMNERTAEFLEPVHLDSRDRLFLSYDSDDDSFRAVLVWMSSEFSNPDGGQTRAGSYNARNWFERFRAVGGEITSQHLEWKLPATDIVAVMINASWAEERIIFDNDDCKSLYQFLLTRFATQFKVGEHKSRFFIENVMPPTPLEVFEDPELPLAEYQRAAVYTSIGQECVAHFMEQGTGKTATFIHRLCTEAEDLHRRLHRALRCIVVVPRSLRRNWVNEIQKWATCRGRITVVRGGLARRVECLTSCLQTDPEDRFTVLIVSYESLVNSWRIFRTMQWDLGCLDESHRIKAERAKRTETCIELRDRCEARHVLTGTPILNVIADLYSQLEFLDKGMSGFTSKSAFKNFYGVYEKRGMYEKEIGCQNLPFLQERLNRIGFCITKKQALPYLPAKGYEIREVEMSAQQREYYEMVQNSLRVEIEEGLQREGKKKLTVAHILTMLLRLAQITSGIIKWDNEYDDDGKLVNAGEPEIIKDNPKIDGLLDIVDEMEPKEKMIIWACFVPDIHQITTALRAKYGENSVVQFYGGTSDDDRLIAEDRFNKDPNCKFFIGNPASAREGLNLWGYDPTNPESDTDCTRVVYFSQNWSSVNRSQSEDRCHRRGTRKHVTYYDLVVPGTIDETIRARVTEKRELGEDVVDWKNVMEAVLNAEIEDQD